MVVVVMAAAASLPVMVMVVLVVILVMVVVVMAAAASLPVMVMVVLVVVIVAVAFHVLIELVVQSGVVDRMEHPVPELVLIHIQDGAHECEADLLHGFELTVALDSVLDIGQVEGDALPVLVHDGGLDVAEEASGFLGDPLADGHEGLAHPGLGIGVPSGDGSLESFGASACDLERGVLVLVMVVIVAAALAIGSVLVAHLIIS